MGNQALVIDWNYMGDVLMSSPVFPALKTKYSRVDVVGYEFCRGVFEGNPFIDEIFTGPPGPKALIKLGDMIRARRFGYDLVLQLNTSLKTNLYMMIAGKNRLGYSYGWKGFPLTIKVPLPYRTCTYGNRSRECLRLLEAVDIYEENSDMVFIPKRRMRQQQDMIGLHINPRSTQDLRRWPYFGILAGKLRTRGFSVFYTGTEADKEYIWATDVNPQIAITPTVQDLATFLTRLRFFITVNTFPMHLAAALKVPTVAIVGATPASVICRETKTFKVLESSDLSAITVRQVLMKIGEL